MKIKKGFFITKSLWMRAVITSTVLLSSLGFSELLTNQLATDLAKETREDAEAVGEHLRHTIESHLQNYLQITSGISAYIKMSDGHLDSRQVELMLESVYSEGEFLRNIGLAPGNRLSYVYPLKGNEAVLGLYYPNLPRQWPAIKKVEEQKTPAMVGPLQLLQGGRGLLYYKPVFLADGTYWGVISVALEADKLFNDVINIQSHEDLSAALRYKPDGTTDINEIFWGDPFAFAVEPVLFDISVPGVSWQLAVAPRPPDAKTLNTIRLEGGVVSIILTLLTLAFLNARARQIETYKRLVSITSRIPGVAFQYFTRLDGISGFSYLSLGTRELYEVDPASVYAESNKLFGCLRPEDQERVKKDVLQSALNLTRWHAIYRVELPEQGLRWHEYDAMPSRQAGTIYWHGHIADITEHKKAEIEYATILNTTHDGFLLCDEKGRFKEVNDAYCRLIGYSREKLLNMSIVDVEANSSPERVKEEIAHVMAYGYAHFETRHRRSDGQIIDLDVSVSSLVDDNRNLIVFVRDISERKHQETLLRDSENRFRSMANGAPALIWLAGLDKGCFWFNQVWLDFTGRSLEQESGEGWIEGVHPDDLERCFETYTTHFERHQAFVMEYRLKRHDGVYRWIRDNGIPRFDTDNDSTFLGYIGSCIDVTDYRNAMEKLKANEERLQFAFEGTGDGMWDWNVETGQTFFSLRWKTMLGYDNEDIRDHVDEWRTRVHPDDMERVLNEIRLHFAGQTQTYVSEHRMLCKDGQYRWLLDRGLVVNRDDEGNPLRMLGTHTDITAMKNADAELAASESRFRSLFEHTPVAYQSLDAECRYLDVNQPLCDMLGYTREELIGQSFSTLLYDSDETYCNYGKSIESLLKNGAVSIELKLKHRDGRPLDVLLNGRVQSDADGGFIRTHSVLADISDQKRVEAEILKAKEAAERLADTRTLFLANMSHEIRTPMNAVLGFLQLLQQTELSIRQIDYVSKAHIAAESLLNILNDILNFSKIESGKLELELTPFRLDDGLRNLSLILSNSSRNKDLDILFDVSPTLPETLIGDPLRLQQILLNLSSNAVKFTDRGEVVIALKDVLTTDEDVLVEFSVTDTGIGISEEKLDAIFEGFTQAESSTTRHFGGTGLGLAISQRLVSLMGGELTVTSQLGLGSCFSFTLAFPYIPVDLSRNAGEQPNSIVRVLVVDDNPHGIISFRKLAQRIGWQVDSTDSGQAALDLLATPRPENQNYQAVFIDRKMTPMDGLTTIRGLRRICESQSRTLPLILMDNRQIYETLTTDVIPESDRPDAFLIKPSTGSMLFDAYTEASSEGLFMDSRIEVRSRSEQLAGLRLLLVEDNPFNQQVASELLTRSGAEIDIANNGKEGVERALAVATPYDAILMDVQMPVMDGYEATRQIRQKGLVDQIIIAMTANAFQSDRDACLAAGMNAYIGKPFSIDALLRVITETHQETLNKVNNVMSGDSDLSAILSEKTLPAGSENEPKDSLPVFDMATALSMLDEDRDLLAELIRMFWQNYPEQRATLGLALERGDGATGKDVAHALKGNAGYFSAQVLRECAAQMELLCKAGNIEAARTLLIEFDAAVERFRQACNEFNLNG